jgi:hypothetical protein
MFMDDVLVNVKDGSMPLAETQIASQRTTDLVCLNFKVPLRVRQQFKVYAARHNITMTELLMQLLNRLPLDAQGQPNAIASQMKK